MEKKCFKCGAVKPFCEFYKHKTMADGCVNKCKECTKIDVIANMKDKIEKYRNYDKNRSNYDERMKGNTIYNRKYRREFPEKYKAHTAVNNAVRRGVLVKPDVCPLCMESTNSREMHGHHSDYNHPLVVEWMCVRCHAKSHPREDWY